MNTFKNAVLALLLTGFIGNKMYAQNDAGIDLVSSLEGALEVLERDAQLYGRLQDEIAKIDLEFDTSAEMRRHLQCCVAHKFDFLNQALESRENELLAIIAEQDRIIDSIKQEFEAHRQEAQAEINALGMMVESLTNELNTYREIDEINDIDRSVEDLFELIAQVQDQYAAMLQQRNAFLAKLECLAAKAYGHFEVEAIESTVFGEQICGTLFCPELDDQPIESVGQDVQVSFSGEQTCIMALDQLKN